jgi:hypothetical protein
LHQDHALSGLAQEKKSTVAQRSDAGERHLAQTLVSRLANPGLQPGLLGVSKHFGGPNWDAAKTMLQLLGIDPYSLEAKQAGQRNKARISGLGGTRHVASILSNDRRQAHQ